MQNVTPADVLTRPVHFRHSPNLSVSPDRTSVAQPLHEWEDDTRDADITLHAGTAGELSASRVARVTWFSNPRSPGTLAMAERHRTALVPATLAVLVTRYYVALKQVSFYIEDLCFQNLFKKYFDILLIDLGEKVLKG